MKYTISVVDVPEDKPIDQPPPIKDPPKENPPKLS